MTHILSTERIGAGLQPMPAQPTLRKGHVVEWVATNVPLTGTGTITVDIQAQITNYYVITRSVSYTHSSTLPTFQSSIAYSYDANGNRTEKWTNGLFTARYFYDSDNQLLGISFNDNLHYVDPGDYAYAYDPFGRRISATEDGVTRYFVFDGLDVIAELSHASRIKDSCLAQRHKVTKAAGPADAGRTNVECQMSNVRPLGFSSKEYDTASGLSYYGFRYYDPASARWMNKDPLLWEGSDQLYVLVNNNPVLQLDLYGLWLNPITAGKKLWRGVAKQEWSFIAGAYAGLGADIQIEHLTCCDGTYQHRQSIVWICAGAGMGGTGGGGSLAQARQGYSVNACPETLERTTFGYPTVQNIQADAGIGLPQWQAKVNRGGAYAYVSEGVIGGFSLGVSVKICHGAVIKNQVTDVCCTITGSDATTVFAPQ